MTVMTNHRYGIWEQDRTFALYEITGKLGHMVRACVCACTLTHTHTIVALHLHDERISVDVGETKVKNYHKVRSLWRRWKGGQRHISIFKPPSPPFGTLWLPREINMSAEYKIWTPRQKDLHYCNVAKPGNSILLAFRGRKDSQE